MQADLVAGFTVAVMTVPQSLSYARIAGLPSQFGLYAAFTPVLCYALFGSSSQLVTTIAATRFFSSVFDFHVPVVPRFCRVFRRMAFCPKQGTLW